jgi:hypothetical protein
MRYTIIHIGLLGTLAALQISTAPANAAQRQYCRSPFPAPIEWLWSCDGPTHAGTNDRSQPHSPVSFSRPSPPSPPDNGGDDGCGDHGPKGEGSRGNRGK